MSQKTDTLIKMGLVFFVTLLSFSIGTYVGKKYSDNQHKLSLLEPKKETQAHAKTEEFANEPEETAKAHDDSAAQMAATEDMKPAALTDSEVAKIAEEFATEDENTEEKIVATINPTEKELKTIEESTRKATVTNKEVAHTKTPAPAQTEKTVEVVESRLPASLPPKKEIVPMLYTVQVGSYPTKSEAEKLTQELQSKGFKTSFVPAQINGQTWFRVNVGLFGTIKEAQEYKKEFLVKSKLASAIVQRVQQ